MSSMDSLVRTTWSAWEGACPITACFVERASRPSRWSRGPRRRNRSASIQVGEVCGCSAPACRSPGRRWAGAWKAEVAAWAVSGQTSSSSDDARMACPCRMGSSAGNPWARPGPCSRHRPRAAMQTWRRWTGVVCWLPPIGGDVPPIAAPRRSQTSCS